MANEDFGTIQLGYFVVAIDKDTKKPVFFVIDVDGYPFWSTSSSSAKVFLKYPQFEQVIGACDYLYNTVDAIGVARSEVIVEDMIDIKDVPVVIKARNKKRAELQAKINELQKEMVSL